MLPGSICQKCGHEALGHVSNCHLWGWLSERIAHSSPHPKFSLDRVLFVPLFQLKFINIYSSLLLWTVFMLIFSFIITCLFKWLSLLPSFSYSTNIYWASALGTGASTVREEKLGSKKGEYLGSGFKSQHCPLLAMCLGAN